MEIKKIPMHRRLPLHLKILAIGSILMMAAIMLFLFSAPPQYGQSTSIYLHLPYYGYWSLTIAGLWMCLTLFLTLNWIGVSTEYYYWRDVPTETPFVLIGQVRAVIPGSEQQKPEYMRKGEYYYHVVIGHFHYTVRREYPLLHQPGIRLEKLRSGEVVISEKKESLLDHGEVIGLG